MTTEDRTQPAGWERLYPLLLAALVVGVYANACTGPFIGDDYPTIVNNPDIVGLGDSLRAIADQRQSSVSGRPVVSLTLAINHALHGFDVWGYHAANVLIHALATLTLFGLIRRTLSVWTPAISPPAVSGFALVAAGLWAVHPLHTESVNYVVQRTELLVGLFFLLTLYAGVRAWSPAGADTATSPAGPQSSGPVKQPSRSVRWRWLWSAAAVVACALGMMSKEVMVAAPLVVLLYDYTFLSGSITKAARRRPLLYLGLGCCWVLLCAIVLGGPRSASVGFHHDISWWQYLLTQAGVLVHYVRLAFWPTSLVISYHDWPIAQSLGDVGWQGPVVLAACGMTIYGVLRRAWWGFLGAVFFLVLAPTSSVVPIVTEIAAERRMYLPLASIACLVLGAAAGFVRHRTTWLQRHNERPPVGSRALALGALAVGGLGLGTATFLRNLDYRSEIAIWADAVEKRPDNPVAHAALAFGLKRAGRAEEALPHVQRAVALDPDYADGHFHLGHVLQLLGRDAEAAAHYREVLRLDPEHDDALYNLGLALRKLGRPGEAAEVFRRLVELRPDRVDGLEALAVCFSATGRKPEAIAAASRAVELDPARPTARYNLAWLLADSGRHGEAVEHYAALLAVRPDDVDARFRLGLSLEAIGRAAEAAEAYRRVLEQQPGHAQARERLRRLDAP